ncbi:MAG: gluconate 2-dehydrogenase subunit 3 family protein [Lysobacterales bacterium]|jgi:gluconate 2-dehydrogenase gamma chain
MNQKKTSRREFLAATGSVAGTGWLAFNAPMLMAAGKEAAARRDAGAKWQNMNRFEAEMLAAVADQIIPPDDLPGASQAGVVWFVDTALGGFMSGAGDALKQGLADLNRQAMKAYPDEDSFAALPFDQQTGLLEAIDDTPFFQLMIFLTHCGMFAMPDRGGNVDLAGWKLLGFENRFAWQPPFGYYDALAAKEAEHANG